MDHRNDSTSGSKHLGGSEFCYQEFLLELKPHTISDRCETKQPTQQFGSHKEPEPV